MSASTIAASTVPLLDAIKSRSSLHNLTDDISVSNDRIQEIVREAILNSPTPFNSQTGRVIVLVKDQHKKFWDMAYDVAKAAVPAELFAKAFESRIKMFRAAYGSILFFDSQDAIKKASEGKPPMVQGKMQQWSEHAIGMMQYAVWTMLVAEGLGVNLQHYNPLMDAAAAMEWNIPEDWTLKAQMVFGKPAGPRFAEKTYEPVEARLKVYGA